MCRNVKCRSPWCLRLEHYIEGFRSTAQVCPNKCTNWVGLGPDAKLIPADISDHPIAPGLCCAKCGTYWVPDLPADVAREMYDERMANWPNGGPGWVEREFKQNAHYITEAVAAA